jgi:hypothetical protein
MLQIGVEEIAEAGASSALILMIQELGTQNKVPVAAVLDPVEDQGAEVFVFSTHENFAGDPEELGAAKISRAEIAEFMPGRPELLPPRITHWIDLA